MSHTVLLCDDAVYIRAMLRGIVGSGNFEVIGEAGNGRAAVELYATLRPDVVIMDMVMPEMNGVEAVRHIRTLDPAARIVMCSTMGQLQLVEEAKDAGAVGTITKPFTATRVLETLTALVAQAG